MSSDVNHIGEPTTDQYVALAVAVTEKAFKEYCECMCDLYCLRFPTRSRYTGIRKEKIRARAIQKIRKTSRKDDEKIVNRFVKEEKRKIDLRARKIEFFFENGICGTAFHFVDGNIAYFRKIAAQLVENYVKTGRLMSKGEYDD